MENRWLNKQRTAGTKDSYSFLCSAQEKTKVVFLSVAMWIMSETFFAICASHPCSMKDMKSRRVSICTFAW